MKNYLLPLFTLFLSQAALAQYRVDAPSFLKDQDKNAISITLKINGKDKTISCQLIASAKSYICPNGENPILMKKIGYGYSAISKDENDKATLIHLSKAQADGKVLYQVQHLKEVDLGGDKDLRHQYTDTVSTIESFFEDELSDTKTQFNIKDAASLRYDKIVQSYLQIADKIKSNLADIAKANNYQIELLDGQQISCQRGKTRKFSKEEIVSQKQYEGILQCGSFQCDSVTVAGKKYQAILIYDSNMKSLHFPSMHLIDSEGIGPQVSIRKIFSKLSKTPIEDRSDTFLNDTYSNHLSYTLPGNLVKNRDKVGIYKNPTFTKVIEHYKGICAPNDKSMNDFLNAKDKLVYELANLELAQFIEILGDGSLVGQFIDPTSAASIGCLYEGVYLNEEAAKNLQRIKKDIHPDKNVDQTISLQKAQELFKQARAMKDIPWEYKQDGCYARAHLMARRFEAQGVRVDKVWLKGQLSVPESKVNWNFHVAPVVYVEDKKGNIQKMVIDPSLFDKAVTVEEWDKKITKSTSRGSVITAFPFPENAALVERAALAFSSSDAYLPSNFAPDGNYNMTEKEKMDLSNETMAEFKKIGKE